MNRSKPWTEPRGGRRKESLITYDKKETGKCLEHGDPDMGEQMIGQKQRPEGKTDLAGTSEDKRINQSKPCTDLPDDQKNQKTAIRIRRINCCLFLCFCKKERCADESGIMV